MSKVAKYKEEIAEYKELLKDKSIPADEREFAENEIKDLEAKIKLEERYKGTPHEHAGKKDKKKAKSKKEKKPAKPANEYKYKGKSIKELSELECAELLAEIKARREKATKSSEKSKSKPVIEKVAANVAKAVKQAVENVPAKDIDKTEIAKFKRIEKAAEAFVTEMKSILGSDWDKEAVQDEFAQITKLIESLRKKYASGAPKAAKGIKVDGKSEEDYEEHLNEIYSENDFDSLVYLTNGNRGEHVSEEELLSALYNGSAGSLLKRYDPIAFNTGYNDWK